MKNYILFILLISTTLLTIPATIHAEVTNKYCPVTTNELAEEKFSLEYKGETIYFCCNGCKKDFLANPDAYLANLVVTKVEIVQTESDNHELDSSNAHGTVTQSVDISERNNSKNSHEPDNAIDHNQTSLLLTFIGKLHPLAIHFPIALVLTALFFTFLSVLTKVDTLNTLSIYLIYFASISAVLSAVLGLIAGSNVSHPSFLVSSFEWHRIFGISTSLVTLLTAYLGYRQLSKKPNGGFILYRLVLILNAILVAITGHLGATLVYGIDYFNF